MMRIPSGLLTGLMVASSAMVMTTSPVHAFVTVTVGTNETWAGTYRVDTQVVDFGNPPPLSLTSQPFWTGGTNSGSGNPDNAFATALAVAIDDRLGKPNFGNTTGPLFAWGFRDTPFPAVLASAFEGTPGASRGLSITGGTFTYATASPVAVPAPLPILGAAAAFGYSRKLRKRIKGGKGRVSKA